MSTNASVRDDCRHYIKRTTNGGEALQRCRVGAADDEPFACPDGCLFFEGRVLSTAGWATESAVPMSNTAWGLAGLPTGKGTSPGKVPFPGKGAPSGRATPPGSPGKTGTRKKRGRN